MVDGPAQRPPPCKARSAGREEGRPLWAGAAQAIGKTQKQIDQCYYCFTELGNVKSSTLNSPFPPPAHRSGRQQRLNEFKTIKWAQITDRFAGTDEADWQLGFRRHRQGHTAAGAAIELGQHNAG